MAMLAAASSAGAAEITTADGVLSINAPGDEWKEKEDSNNWFAVSDGKNTITIDHLSNGEILPPMDIAENDNEAICQTFISTRNEVFVVKGLAASREDLDAVIKMIGTIKVLKFDTKTAVQKEVQTAGNGQFGLRRIDAVYFVTTDVLNVRSGCSTDEAAIGVFYYGEPVTVTGAVTMNGEDDGWYEVQYNGTAGYVSSGFLSETEPAAKAAENGQAEGSDKVQCEYCGQWFVPGDAYREHLLAHANTDLNAGKEQCQYCGEWFVPGDAYREHLLAHANEDLYAGKEQCQYCGEWFVPDDAYREHLLAHANEDLSAGQ